MQRNFVPDDLCEMKAKRISLFCAINCTFREIPFYTKVSLTRNKTEWNKTKLNRIGQFFDEISEKSSKLWHPYMKVDLKTSLELNPPSPHPLPPVGLCYLSINYHKQREGIVTLDVILHAILDLSISNQCCGSASFWCRSGCGSGFDISPWWRSGFRSFIWYGSGSSFSPWCGSGSRS